MFPHIFSILLAIATAQAPAAGAASPPGLPELREGPEQ